MIYSQVEAIVISHQLDGLVDAFFIDAEKKLPVAFNPNYDLLEHFKLTQYVSKNNIEFGNISSVCNRVVKSSECFQYKANDLSVDAVWYYMVQYFKELSGKHIVIAGSGNAGNKIALKLVESGANVTMLSNHPDTANVIANSINLMKNKHALSHVVLSHEALYAAVDADAIIGCTNNVPAITPEMVKVMKPTGVVIDFGTGTIFEDAVEECITRGINTWRVDISAMLSGMVMNNKATKDLFQNQYGRGEKLNSVYILSQVAIWGKNMTL